MELLDGKKVKIEILENVKKELSEIDEKIKLVVIEVGNDEASKVYLKQKEKMANEVGYLYEEYHFEETISEDALLDVIDRLNEDKEVHAILVQMPLPNHIDANKVQNRVDPLKDVDGLSNVNYSKLVKEEDCLIPCTAMGIIDLLDYYNIDLKYKNVCIIGRSNLIGKPLSGLMLNRDATVTICHSKTLDISAFTKVSDIVVVAVGIPNFINGNMLKEGSILVDAGINKVDNKLVGDSNYESIIDVCEYATPVPGGVGQLTVAELSKNILKAYKMQQKG